MYLKSIFIIPKETKTLDKSSELCNNWGSLT